jgi:hypothetical protein
MTMKKDKSINKHIIDVKKSHRNKVNFRIKIRKLEKYNFMRKSNKIIKKIKNI